MLHNKECCIIRLALHDTYYVALDFCYKRRAIRPSLFQDSLQTGLETQYKLLIAHACINKKKDDNHQIWVQVCRLAIDPGDFFQVLLHAILKPPSQLIPEDYIKN